MSLFRYKRKKHLKVIKKDHSEELFSRDKLCASLEEIGVEEKLGKRICRMVEKSVRDKISTTEIFRMTRDYLYEYHPDLSALYSLARGLSALGPAGFVFEQYIGAILIEMGYHVEMNVYLEGEGVSHEIDVFAEKGNVVFLVEAKYKNDFKLKTHIDKVMYADARLQDIRRKAKLDGDDREYYMWVITNTRFTDNAILYVTHRDIQLLGWDYPPFINIMKLVHEKKLYPVTILPSITRSALKKMSQMELILVKHLVPYTVNDYMERFSLSHRLAKKLYREVHELMKNDFV